MMDHHYRVEVYKAGVLFKVRAFINYPTASVYAERWLHEGYEVKFHLYHPY